MRGLKYIAVVIGLVLVQTAAVQAQRIQARAVIDSTNILIGDQINLRIELDQPNNVTIEFPVIGDSQ